jgi:hypothetical protein
VREKMNEFEKNIIRQLKKKKYKELEEWEKLYLKMNKEEYEKRKKRYEHEMLVDPFTFEYTKR